ncbi:MAG: hypothetical protein V4513_03290 [Pseudomonadota bacterium]
MSRVLFLSLSESEVIAKCQHEKVGISAIENLPGGGVRLVCMSSDGAATLNRKLKSQLIKGDVKRGAHRPAQPLW